MAKYNTINHVLANTSLDEDAVEFTPFGKDIISSEELTDSVYTSFVSMITKGWEGPDNINKKEFHCSDIGLIYNIGPYIPCVERMSFTQNIDLVTDGLPGIRVVGDASNTPYTVSCVRPIDRLPNDIQLLGRCIKKYKYISLWPSKESNDKMESLVLWFGINKDGKVMSAYNKRSILPDFFHGAAKGYPSIVMNAWADSKYLWLAKTSEDIGICDLKLRLGLSKEHIKSLFYARSLPVTETGRKRPILHWVRAHQRRLKDGIDIDINPYLRGITEIEMDGLRFQITQPNKADLHEAEPNTVREAFKMYGPRHDRTRNSAP